LLALRNDGFDVVHEQVDTPQAMRDALTHERWDVITSDHAMPCFSAPAALALAKELCPDIPFIIVSGEIDIKLAVSLVRDGADDYIQKNELLRLASAIERALRDVELCDQHRSAIAAVEISETRYRRLFETAQDGILILNAETGQIDDVNPFLIDMLGFTLDEFMGKRLWEIGAFGDADASRATFHTLQREGYVRYEDQPLKTRDGQLVSVEFVSNVYFVDGKKVAQCNIRDITDRKRVEAEVRQLNIDLEKRVQERTVQLEALNVELEAFNASVSHDLRAPLRRIGGFTDILIGNQTDRPDAASLQFLQSIRVSVDRMSALIDALLSLALFSRTDVQQQSVDLSSIARHVTMELQQSQPDRQIELEIAEDAKTIGDPQLLLIVMENLLGNAWKFTAKTRQARIGFGSALQADGKVAFFVQDNGAGFDMTYGKKLFSPFQRLHHEKEFPGIGIGLATVQRIIHRHHGRVWAEGSVNEGATIYFTIGRL